MVVHGKKLRWLLWLRWKLLWRRYTRAGQASAIVGTVFLLIFTVLFGGSIALGTFFGYRFAPAPVNTEILFLVFTGIYVLWIVSPLLQISTNEGLDISKLSLFPLTREELMASLLLSTLLDIPTITLFLLFSAVVAGWAFSVPLALVALATVLIFYVQLIGMGQLVIALLARSLQSRRLRDLSIILVILVSASGYLCNFALRGSGAMSFATMLENGTFSTYLQWLPPGIAARAIQQAYAGNWGMSFAWLALSLALAVVVLYLWQVVVTRSLTAPESGGGKRVSRKRAEQVHQPARSVPAGAYAPVSPGNVALRQIIAIARKDVTYYRRDPQFIRLIILPLFYVVFLSISTVFGSSSGSVYGASRILFAPAIVLLSLYSLAYNTLGFERQSLTTLFLFPIDPKRVLWGKNLVVFVLGLIEILLVVLLTGFVSHIWTYVLPSLTICLAGIGIILGCGNFTSVFLPQRMRQIQRGYQSTTGMTTEAGCLRFVMSLVAMLVTLLILLPVGLAMFLPLIFHIEWAWALSIPASLLYGALIYFVVTMLVAPRMLTRAPEILEVVAKE